MYKILAIAIVVLLPILTSCSAHSVAKTGNPDEYVIKVVHNVPFATLAGAKEKAYRQATAQCEQLGAQFVESYALDIPTGFYQPPETTMYFKCSKD